MNRAFLFGIFVLAFSSAYSQQIISPVKKNKSSFAIIIDRDTFAKTDSAVFVYRDAVENDGLSVFILIKNWNNPDEIKKAVHNLHKTSNLEGMVMIGEIPIPMINNAPHLTSSHKMMKSLAEINTSVASDRFYDDFDLKFKYNKKDRDNGLLFYYSLLPESPQRIEKDIYSARIMPPGKSSERFDKIKTFLLKAANEKKNTNKLNDMMVFTGYGYHSESLTSWSDEQLFLREELPSLYKPGGRLKKIEYAMNRNIKDLLLQEIQNTDLDVAVFHAHGTNKIQYLVEKYDNASLTENIDDLKRYFRDRIRETSVKDVPKTIQYYKKTLGIPDEWFKDAFTDSIAMNDVLAKKDMNIYPEDVRKISPGAKVILFDQCSIGSFQLENYLAGEYLFNNGHNIAGIANTETTLQDQWTTEYIGLLDFGFRVGDWHKMNNVLESHLIGDPTFHFSKNHSFNTDSLISSAGRNMYLWEDLLGSDNPVPMRYLALRELYRQMREGMEDKLLDMYYNESSISLRLEALKCIADLNEASFERILPVSLNDPFEYIRRMSAIWMGKVGRKEYLPVMVKQFMNDESKRVIFNLKRSMVFINPEEAYNECVKYIETMPGAKNRKNLKEVFKIFLLDTGRQLSKDVLQVLKDSDENVKKKIREVKTFRNYNFQPALPDLMEIARNKSEIPELRTAILEVLGWYGFSYNREIILVLCEEILNDAKNPKSVQNEALKTKNRILEGSNNPFAS